MFRVGIVILSLIFPIKLIVFYIIGSVFRADFFISLFYFVILHW